MEMAERAEQKIRSKSLIKKRERVGMSPLAIRFQWHCRRAGGLFLGARLQFPACILFDDGKTRIVTHLSIGFLVATLQVELRRKHNLRMSKKPSAEGGGE